jgi:hypothetical protein
MRLALDRSQTIRNRRGRSNVGKLAVSIIGIVLVLMIVEGFLPAPAVHLIAP